MFFHIMQFFLSIHELQKVKVEYETISEKKKKHLEICDYFGSFGKRSGSSLIGKNVW